MEVKEAIKLKREAERHIAKVISNFCQETNLRVEDIELTVGEIDSFQKKGEFSTYSIEIIVRL